MSEEARWHESVPAALVAAAIAVLFIRFGPPGTDLAAHVYQRSLFIEHGFVLWNNLWYAGRYDFVTYSVLYYPLAALVGIHVLAVATVAISTLAFSIVCEHEWGQLARWSTRSFAVIWPGIVLTAAFPFTLGVAFALLSLWALEKRRNWVFAVLTVLTLAASPLAFLLLTLLLVGIAIAYRNEPGRLRAPAVVVAGCFTVELLLRRLFPDHGSFPFSLVDLAAASLFAVFGAILTWQVGPARNLRWLFVVYLAACLGDFLVPTDLGANIGRLRLAAIPICLLVVSLRRWRPLPLCIVVVALAAGWNVTPLVRAASAAHDPSAQASYWSPAIAFLDRHRDASYRVEAVDTAGHWAAVYLPDAGIPIARGWFRQNDFPQNRLLYEPLRAATYRAWLRSLGIRYVVLTSAPPDYSAQREAGLLRSGHSGLVRVMHTRTLAIYALPAPRPIITGSAAARITRVSDTQLDVWVARAGTYRLAVRDSPYWHADRACLTPTSGGMISLTTHRGGDVQLDFAVDAGDALAALVGSLGDVRCSSAVASSSVH